MNESWARVWKALLGAAGLAAMLNAACVRFSEEDPRFSNFCDPSQISVCDVRDPACQQAVLSYAACLTEREEGALPAVHFLADTSTVVFRPENPRVDAARPGLSLLGLVSPTRFQGEPVESWYDRRTHEIFWPGARRDPAEEILALAELMTYALQTSAGDLAALMSHEDGTIDRGAALHAVIRGEAGLAQRLFAKALGLAEDASPPQIRDPEQSLEAQLAKAPYPLEVGLAPFGSWVGERLVWRVWLAEGNGGVRALFRAPPETTAEVLSVSKGWNDDPRAALLEERARREPIEGAPSLPFALQSYRLDGDVMVGRWGHLLFVHRLFSELRRKDPDGTTTPLSLWGFESWNERWRGDRLWSYTSEKTGARAFVWLLRFDRSFYGTPEQLNSALELIGAPWRFSERGEDHLLVGCDDPEQLEAWLEVGEALAGARF